MMHLHRCFTRGPSRHMLDSRQVRGPDGYVAQERSPVMNTLWIVVIATVVIYLAYNFYARRIDRDIIKADAKRATPAKMYMDGVDFMPTSKNRSEERRVGKEC